MPFQRRLPLVLVVLLAVLAVLLSAGCDASPKTDVVLENDYPPSSSPANALVVYHAFWQAVSFQTPVPPGASSDLESTVPASPNTAYALLAPGYDPAGSAPPASFVVLKSRTGLEVHLHETLHIHVADATFAGNCAAGSSLSQADADFITQLIFPGDFANLAYDAASCTTTPVRKTPAGDAGAP